MTEAIRSKVARVLNSREIVIAAGSEQGVRVGMYFDVLDPKGEDIRDPDTGEILGSIDRPKVRVRVSKVQDRLAVASTFKKEQINIGGVAKGTDLASLASFGILGRSLMPPKYVTKYETLKTDEKTWEDLDEAQSYVKTGDPVLQVDQPVDVSEVENVS